jgi:membrane protein required for beta-lactamase induction
VQEWGGRKSVSAWLEWIVVRKVSFSMSETGLGQKCLFQQEWFQMPLNIINVVAGSPVPF